MNKRTRKSLMGMTHHTIMAIPASQSLDKFFLRALRLSLVASRGGVMRARILHALDAHHLNPLALAKMLSIDYKTAIYHLEKLQKQNLVLKKGEGYGAVYATTFTPEQRVAFHKIMEEMGESL